MKTHTSQFKEQIKRFGRELDSKITYTLNNEEIVLGKEQLNAITPHYEGDILKSVMKQLDIDSNVDIPIGTEINYQFGVKVNNNYEYLDYGNYIVYSSEKQEDTRSYKIVCYDKMLYAMKNYERLDIEYPITLKNYLSALCTKIGLTLNDTDFVNYDKEIENELYLDSDGNSLDYTYRDILDEIAGATASTICINDDDELEVRYVKEYKLPSGYAELDYIENNNEQYIDTGIIPTTNTKIDLDFMYLGDYYDGWNSPFGERGSTNTTYFGMFIQHSSLILSPNYAGFDPGTGSNTSIVANTKYNFRNDKGQWYINEELKSGMSTTNTLVQGDKSIYLFAMNQNGSVRRGTQIRIYRCKFYEGDTLIRDYIPTLRLSDNKTGLYDIVNDEFYTNQFSWGAQFTYGKVVNESIDLIDEEYLKDINVNFGEKYGPVNSVVFSRSAESDNIYRQDEDSIEENGLHEIKIKDNQILNGNNRDEFIDGVFNQLNGFEYYANDFSSTGIAYYDLCDRYNVKVDNNIYNCIMMNDELDVSQGLEEKVHLDIPEKSETDYKKADKTDRRINETWIIANKQEGYIEALTSRTTSLEENTYTITQVNDLIQNAESGITNTFTEAGGNNIFRNTGLWFENSGTDSQQNPYEFWTGVVVRVKEENASNMNGLSLQNTTLKQQQVVVNGYYTISFKYKKLLTLATVSVIINGNEFELTETNETEFTQTIEVKTQYIDVDFICDTNDGCEIYDLMVNSGQTKLAYSQNQNETTTDTVNISKGITITSSDLDVKFKADADGIRILDSGNNITTKFTDVGMTTDEATINGKSTIVGTLWEEVNEQTWITRL